jgi:hypothetical protein
MTSPTRSLTDKSSSATNESIITGGCDDQEGLTTLDGRGSIALITLVLVDCKRLARNGRLVDLEEGIVGNNTAICRNDSTLLKRLLGLFRRDFLDLFGNLLLQFGECHLERLLEPQFRRDGRHGEQ